MKYPFYIESLRGEDSEGFAYYAPTYGDLKKIGDALVGLNSAVPVLESKLSTSQRAMRIAGEGVSRATGVEGTNPEKVARKRERAVYRWLEAWGANVVGLLKRELEEVFPHSRLVVTGLMPKQFEEDDPADDMFLLDPLTNDELRVRIFRPNFQISAEKEASFGRCPSLQRCGHICAPIAAYSCATSRKNSNNSNYGEQLVEATREAIERWAADFDGEPPYAATWLDSSRGNNGREFFWRRAYIVIYKWNEHSCRTVSNVKAEQQTENWFENLVRDVFCTIPTTPTPSSPRWAGQRDLSHFPSRFLLLKDIIKIANHVLKALAALESHGILHNAVIPKNILCTQKGDQTMWMLTDPCTDLHLIRRYMTPECELTYPRHQGKWNDANAPGKKLRSDVFMLGIVLAELFIGRHLWEQPVPGEDLREQDEIMHELNKGAAKIDFEAKSARRRSQRYVEEFARTLKTMISGERLERPSAESLSACFQKLGE